MVVVSGETKNTLILVGVFGFLAIALMSARLMLRRVRGQKFNWSDYLTMAAIFCMVGRTSFTTVVLLWQNNNVTTAFRAKHTFTGPEIYRREIGGKLTLVNRVIYNTYIWIQKCVVLLLYHRMLAGIQWAERIMKAYWIILLLTLIPVQVSCFVECHPVRLYWQVVPDPGKCSTAVAQLYVLVAMNIFTDVLLILLPMPWLLTIKRSVIQRLQLIGLFSIGLGLIVIAICRLPIYGAGTTQISRNTLGSIEGFFAAFVANVPTIVTLRRHNPDSSLRGSRDASEDGLSGGTRDMKYSRDNLRRISSADGEGILVTRDIEMTSHDKTEHDEIYSKHLRPGQESDEELIR